MKSIDNILNAIMSNFYHLAPWLLRLGLGTSFVFHGLSKFPLPPQKLIDYFGFSSELASFVAIYELGAGILLLLGGFLKGHVGNLVTRFAAGVIVIVMIFAFTIAHSDWFITPKLFMSEQIFLIIIGLYFFIRGNN
ncbi:MAG: DoxX family protein [Nitrosomonadales bacterium]|nr:DoxX family protein [Nitrosomonadales bacterium]